MPEPIDFRDIAASTMVDTAKIMADCTGYTMVDIHAVQATIQSASTAALLYVGDQIREQVAVQRELVEQQKLTNVLTALAMDADRTPLSWDTESAAQDYIQARIGDIVNPRPESENQQ